MLMLDHISIMINFDVWWNAKIEMVESLLDICCLQLSDLAKLVGLI